MPPFSSPNVQRISSASTMKKPFGQSIQRVDRDAQFALNELKRQPDYPAIRLRALEKSESLFKSVGSQLPKPALPSQERLDCAIKSMDIWAGAYTGLIANLADQENYLKVLAGLRLHAWKLYSGMTGIEPLPYNQAWVAIRDRSAHWQKESLRRLVPPQAPLPDQTVSEPHGLPFTEPAHSAGQPAEGSKKAPPSSAASAQQGKSLDDFDSEAARTSAVADYIERWTCSEAALARTAIVDSADLSKWKKGSLPSGSDKKARIENALRNNEPATPAGNRPKNS